MFSFSIHCTFSPHIPVIKHFNTILQEERKLDSVSAYICFRLADFDFPGSPYIELRSRDCTNNNFIARILTNGLDEIEKNHLTCEQCALIRKEIRDYLRNNKTVFKVNNGEKNNKQLGINKETNNNIETNEVFINKLEETLKDFEDIIRSLSLYPRN